MSKNEKTIKCDCDINSLCGDAFNVKHIFSCRDCEHNGFLEWYNNDEDYRYIYDSKNDELARCQVEDTDQCKYGEAWGGGCVFMECIKCGGVQRIPHSDCY